MSQSNGAPGSLKSSGRTDTWWPQTAITASGMRSRTRAATETAAVYCRADQQETTTRSASCSASSAPPICRKLSRPTSSSGLPSSASRSSTSVSNPSRRSSVKSWTSSGLTLGPSAQRPPYRDPGNTSSTRVSCMFVSSWARDRRSRGNVICGLPTRVMLGLRRVYSTKSRRLLASRYARSFASVLASIWRMRSRVTPNCTPTSSRVCGRPSVRP